MCLIADLDASWGSSGHSRGAPGVPLFVRVVRTRGNLETAGAVCCLFAGTTSAVNVSRSQQLLDKLKFSVVQAARATYQLHSSTPRDPPHFAQRLVLSFELLLYKRLQNFELPGIPGQTR